MILFLLLIVVLLIGLTILAVMGRIGGSMADPTSSQSFALPVGPLSADDLIELHIDQALRGYRMDQVDEVIDALGARIRELESEIASPPVPEASPPVPDDSPSVPDASPAAESDAHDVSRDPQEQ